MGDVRDGIKLLIDIVKGALVLALFIGAVFGALALLALFAWVMP